MRRQKKHAGPRWKLFFALACVLLLCIVFMGDGIRSVERMIYPRKYEDLVSYYAQKYHIDENQVYAIIRTESGFDPQAQSNVGARGLMQITEETFDWIKTKIAPDETVAFGDLYDPETNIRFGTYLLAVCLARYGEDLSTAAAAYHSGLGKVDSLLQSGKYSPDGIKLSTFPYQQMNHYVNKVNANYKKYTALYGDEKGET